MYGFEEDDHLPLTWNGRGCMNWKIEMASPVRELAYGPVEIYHDMTFGIGSYGKVCRAKYGHLPCAAKLLHDTMFQTIDPGIQKFVERFEQECAFLRMIKHPNIVQYLGTSRDPQSGRLTLLMELMDESLTGFLERSTFPLPYHTQVNICYDVALALAHLHFNKIIHRDLSSNNVLLIGDGSRAKVTDFGMSKLMGMNPRMTKLTMCPGTAAYMPPEALLTPPQYSDKLDCFSHGVMAIQVITRQFPSPGDAHKYSVSKGQKAKGARRSLQQIPESERRKKDLDLVEPTHPLLPLALNCIEDIDSERPSAEEICERLTALKKEERYTSSVEKSSIQRLQLDIEAKNHVIVGKDLELANARQRVEEEEERSAKAIADVEKINEEHESRLEMALADAELKWKEDRQKFQKARVAVESKLKVAIAAAEAMQEEGQTKLNEAIITAENIRKELKTKDAFIKQIVAESQRLLAAKEQQLREEFKTEVEMMQREFAERLTRAIPDREENVSSLDSRLARMQNEALSCSSKGKEALHGLKITPAITKLEEIATLEGMVWGASPSAEPPPYSYGDQKTEVHAALQQRLRRGETWYLVDVRWMKQWKKYVGYDEWDQSLAGQESAAPGPVDNSDLFKDCEKGLLKEHLMEELDYFLLPILAWYKLVSWYGVTQGSRPIARKVVEHGQYMKHCKVEVYLLKLKLSLHSNPINVEISRGNSVAELEWKMKEIFSVAKDTECRMWHRYMTNTYELLKNPSQTVQDAGLYNGQTVVLELKNEDGTWPRSVQVSKNEAHNVQVHCTKPN